MDSQHNKYTNSLPPIEDMASKFAYEMGWGDFTQSKQGQNIFEFLYSSAQQCAPESIILDVSAGECRYKPFFQHGQYVAIDSMIGDVNWDFTKLDLIGDAMNLPIKTASIDVCLNFTSLEHYPEPGKAFQEFARVLKPGGRLFLYVPFVQPEHQIPYDFFRYTRYGLAHLCNQNGLEIELLKPSNSILETVLDLLKMTIGFISEQEIKDHLKEVVDIEINPIFQALDDLNEGCVDFPDHPLIPQMPMAYCLSAIKPGASDKSNIYNSKPELLQAITACPNCHNENDLDWNSSNIHCSQCHTTYSFTKEIPNFC